jgi:hypothetical protein
LPSSRAPFESEVIGPANGGQGDAISPLPRESIIDYVSKQALRLRLRWEHRTNRKRLRTLRGGRFFRRAEERRDIEAGIVCNFEGDRRADDEAVNWIAATCLMISRRRKVANTSSRVSTIPNVGETHEARIRQ